MAPGSYSNTHTSYLEICLVNQFLLACKPENIKKQVAKRFVKNCFDLFASRKCFNRCII